ncbi:hypothetical protein D3C78_1126910 [compost metagenome]
MIDQHPTTLAALVAVLQRQFEGRPSHTGEDLAHMGTGIGPGGAHGAVVTVPFGNGEAARDTYVIEVDFPLGQGTLTDFFQRLALGNSLDIQRDDHRNAVGQTILAVETVTVVGAHQAEGHLRDSTVGHPGRALAIDDDLVANDLGSQVADVGRRTHGPIALDIEQLVVAAAIRLGGHPATDPPLAQLDQFGVAGSDGHLQGEASTPKGDRQASIAPPQLFADHGFDPHCHLRRQLR